MNAHVLGRMLRPFGLRSKAQKVEGRALKVYELDPLKKVSKRYSETDGVQGGGVQSKLRNRWGYKT